MPSRRSRAAPHTFPWIATRSPSLGLAMTAVGEPEIIPLYPEMSQAPKPVMKASIAGLMVK